MPFDPTKPANNTPLDAAEIRAQLTSLKDMVDLRLDTAGAMALISEQTSGPASGVALLSLTVSNPPTQAQVQTVVAKINELITALKSRP